MKHTEEKQIVHVRLQESDRKMLTILHRVPWAYDWHIALLTGLPVKYTRRRLQTLAQGGLIKRVEIGAGDSACNYITADGIREAGLTPISTNPPNYYSYLHDRGMIDTYVYLSIFRVKSGGTYTDFGSIITERSFLSVSETQPTGKFKSNGQPILKSLDDGIHQPDGYLFKGDKIFAIEFERVLKTKTSNSKLKDNVLDMRKRFDRQIWVCGTKAVKKRLEEIKKEVTELILLDYSDVETYLSRAVEKLPKKRPALTGIAPVEHIGTLRDPIPLHRLPLKQTVTLEQSSSQAPARTVQLER